MRLTKNFSLSEFETSATAMARGIDNSVPADKLGNVKMVAERLQSLRDYICDVEEENVPIRITSGYRGPNLNKNIEDASLTSDHMMGFAADIRAKGFTTEELLRQIIVWSEVSGHKFDQLINEYGSWVHISFAPKLRGHIMLARRDWKGKTVYERII